MGCGDIGLLSSAFGVFGYGWGSWLGFRVLRVWAFGVWGLGQFRAQGLVRGRGFRVYGCDSSQHGVDRGFQRFQQANAGNPKACRCLPEVLL